MPGFDYSANPGVKLEVPIAERIAKIRTRKAEERARAKINAERRAAGGVRAAARAPTSQRSRRGRRHS